MKLYFKYVAMQLKAELEYKKAFALSLCYLQYRHLFQ